MKITRLVLILFFILRTLLMSAITIDEQKEAIKRIWICHTVWNSISPKYIIPSTYTYDEAGNLSGQLYYSFGERKYEQLFIDFSKQNPLKAAFSLNAMSLYSNNTTPRDVELTWTGDELSRVEIKGFANFNYAISKDGDNYVLIKEYVVNKKNHSEKIVVEIKDDNISKITNILPITKKGVVFYITEYTYPSEQSVGLHRIFYSNIKGKKNKGFLEPATDLYEIKDENRVYFNSDILGSTEIVYNPDGIIIEKNQESKTCKMQTLFEYIDKERFKGTTYEIRNGVEEKEILIFFDLPDADKKQPKWEWKKGIYRFDVNNDLIYERDGNQYRKKIDGYWTNWMFVRI